MQVVSDLGDSALLLPLSIGLILLLWRGQSRSAALALVAALSLCLTLTLLFKIGFIACSPSWHTDIVSPSGHASFSTVTYGALALVAVRHAPRWQKVSIALLASILIGCIAVSRVTTGSHSAAEVGAGLLIGLSSLGLFAFRYLRQRPGTIKLPLLFGFAAFVLVAFHGVRLPAEQWVRELAQLTRGISGGCPGESAREGQSVRQRLAGALSERRENNAGRLKGGRYRGTDL